MDCLKTAYSLFLLIKFYWNSATHIHLHIDYDSFYTIMAESGSCDKDQLAHKDKKLTDTSQKNGRILLYRMWTSLLLLEGWILGQIASLC